MAAALRTLGALHKPGRAIAVLGDMLELGPTELQLHAEIGEVVAEVEVALLITVGQRAAHIAATATKRGVTTLAAADAEAAAQALLARTEPGDWILLKGSRGMALEGVLDRFRALCANGTEAAPAADQGMH
jgi:UDP-N-acetylmuramyl pentapeptide synthase